MFGPEYVQAQWALILLSVGLLVAVVGGPSDAVILMSGRSRQSLANSTIAFSVNLVGNLLLVPIWGISAAGGVWAATLVVAAGLPALQARRSLGLTPWSPELRRTILVALGTVGTACVLSLAVLGATRRRPRRRDRPRHRRLRRVHVAPAPVDPSAGTARQPARRLPAHPSRPTTDLGALMTSERETPTLTDYWAILRRRRRTIALATVVVVAFAAVYVWWSGPQYASQASVVIRPILTGPFDQSRIDDVGAGTEAKVLDSTVVAELAAKKLHADPGRRAGAARAPHGREPARHADPEHHLRGVEPRGRADRARRRSPTRTSSTASRPPTR